MAEKTNVPEIRFAGFTDPWEQRKFSDLTDRVSIQSNDPNLPQVEYEDIISGEGALNKDLNDKEGGKTGIKFYVGDVLYGKLRPYLMNWLYPQFNGVAVGDFWVLRATECDSSFLYRLVQTDGFQRLANVSSGSKMPRADWNLISQSFFAVPANHAEQKAIAKSLAELDSLITLHQRKYDKLAQLKKSMLDKMFPKPGERFPEIRFAGFTDPWEQRKFSELATLRRGLTYSPANIRPYGQGVRVLRSSNIAEDEFVLSREDVFVDEDVVKMDLAQDDEILITAANGSPRLVGKRAKIHDLAGKTVHGGFMLCARAEQPDFVVALMGSQWYQRFLVTGVAGGNGSIGNLDKEALENETALIPRTEEQRLIGAHFSRLDALITLHQRECQYHSLCGYLLGNSVSWATVGQPMAV